MSDYNPHDTGESAQLPDDEGIAAGSSVFGDEYEAVEDPALTGWQATELDPMGTGMSEPVLVEAGSGEMEAWSDYAASPEWADAGEAFPAMEPQESVGPSHEGEDFFGYDDSDPYSGYASDALAGGERDMPTAVVVGLVMAAAIFVAMRFGPAVALAVAVVVLGLAAVELFNAMRIADYQPAVLLGLTAVVMMPLAVYWRGSEAITVVLALTMVFGALWYLTGAGPKGPMRGLASTVFGVAYIGVLGSHVGLILAVPDHGTGLLTAAILFTVAYDTGGLLVGRSAGRNPLSAASPNKTIEGLVGGCLLALLVGVVMGLLQVPAPVADGPGDIWSAVLLALAAAVAAPIGDLAESLLKRDLGIKDMGTILPGHGGVLDRFDGLLFVLPTMYYTALVLEVI